MVPSLGCDQLCESLLLFLGGLFHCVYALPHPLGHRGIKAVLHGCPVAAVGQSVFRAPLLVPWSNTALDWGVGLILRSH